MRTVIFFVFFDAVSIIRVLVSQQKAVSLLSGKGAHLSIAGVVSPTVTAPADAATPDFHVAMAQQTPIPATVGEGSNVTASDQAPPLESL